jgi:hypothetical protein
VVSEGLHPTEYALWMEACKRNDLIGVSAEEVPDLVRQGNTVWSFGYGWDQGDLEPGEYTTIQESDLWAWAEDDKEVVDSWGPFACEQP